jgi:hypothetical protein
MGRLWPVSVRRIAPVSGSQSFTSVPSPLVASSAPSGMPLAANVRPSGEKWTVVNASL